jgi:hypothetical protein
MDPAKIQRLQDSKYTTVEQGKFGGKGEIELRFELAAIM